MFKMPFKIAKAALKGRKNFFKVCLVGTLNLCLKEPEKMQKTRNQSDHPRQRKRPKTLKNFFWGLLKGFWRFKKPF